MTQEVNEDEAAKRENGGDHSMPDDIIGGNRRRHFQFENRLSRE